MTRPVALLLATLLLPSGCTRIAALVLRPPTIARCEQTLPSTDRVSGDFTRRLRVHVSSGEVSEGYQVVLQKRGDTLTMIGLTRFGAKAFTVVQRGHNVEAASHMDSLTPVPPLNILHDMYRWPLRVVTDATVRIQAEEDGVTLTHETCNYRTRIVEIES